MNEQAAAVLMAFEQNYGMEVEMTMTSSDEDAISQDPNSRSEPQERVFDTTELLEMILAWLPLPSLLRVQSVSQQWRDLIRDSLILQQQLFLKPEKSDKVWLAEVANLPAQNRPLRRDYKSNLRVLAEVSRHSRHLHAYHGLMATPVRPNDLLLHPDPFINDPNDIDKKVDIGFVGELSLDTKLLQTIKQHPSRNMLLTQPPVTRLCAEVLSECGSLGSKQLNVPDGVRLHHVAEVLEQGCMSHRVEGIKLFMSGAVAPTEEDVREVRKRTEEWNREMQVQV